MRPVYYNNGTIFKVTFEISTPRQTLERYFDVVNNTPIDPTGLVLVQDFPQPIFNDSLCCTDPVPECHIHSCQLPLVFDSPFVTFQALVYELTLVVELEYLKINGVTVLSNETITMMAADIVIENIDGHNIYVNLYEWLRDIFEPWIEVTLSAETNGFETIDLVTFTYDDCVVQSYEFSLIGGNFDRVGFDDVVVDQNGYVSVEGGYEDESIINYYKGSPTCL